MQNLIYEGNGIRLGQNGDACTHPDAAWDYVADKQPTCTEEGYHDSVKCKECGTWIIKHPIVALGHSFGEATCQKAATCSRCNAVQGSKLTCQDNGTGVCRWCGRNLVTITEDKPGGEDTEGAAITAPAESTEAPALDTEPTASTAAAEVTNPESIADVTVEEILGGNDKETTEATEKPAPVEPGYFHNPFGYGCWTYILLALVVGIVTGWFLNGFLTKKKKSKRRPRPYTEVDFGATPPTTAQPAAAPAASVAAPVAAPVAATGVSAAVHQHIGARKDQQDSYGVSDLNAYATNGVLAVVADGMGGLANGAAVSSTLVHSLLTYFRQTTGRENTADMMLDMVTQANDQINRMLQGADRSGSTLVSVIIREGRLHFLTVGDSRLYLYRKGILLQLNREHIYQEELALKAVNHIVPLQQVTGDRQAHALTSYLGIGRLTHIDRNYDSIKLEPGDRLLLASDGVFGTLSEQDMENALRSNISQAAEIMGQMILKVNAPYQDNNTALVLEYRG